MTKALSLDDQMIEVPNRKKSVLILGAGASSGLQYPCGKELIDQICLMLNPERDPPSSYRKKLLRVGFQADQIDDFQRRLRHSYETIDTFLDHNRDLEFLGKLAITLELSSHEHRGVFGRDAFAVQDWYGAFWNGLQKNFELVRGNQLFVITFNYDRSLEHFLFLASEEARRDLHPELVSWLNSDRFLHIHGRMGCLEWQTQAPPERRRRYASDCGDNEDEDGLQSLKRSAELILLPHESDRLDANVEVIVSDAERILFLGFGFDERNLRKLGFESWPRIGVRNVFATMKSDVSERKEKLQQQCPMLRTPEKMHEGIYDCLKQSGFPNW